MLTAMTSLYLPAVDERSMQRQLRELDDHLILTRERDHLGRDYYVVIFYTDGTVPPAFIEDWRDPDGTPRQLSSALPLMIQKRMKEGPTSLKKINAHNDALKASHDADMEAAYEEQALSVAKSARTSAMLPRSQSLYLARQREREAKARRGGK